MEIRKATTKDAATLSALNVDVQRIHAAAFPEIFKQPENDSFALDFMLERLADPLNTFLIVSDHGVDAGYVFVKIIDRPENPFTHAWKFLYIDQISVKPAYRGRGYGKALMQAVRKLAQEMGIETIALDTWSFNEQALAFFREQGFATFNERLWTSTTPPHWGSCSD